MKVLFASILALFLAVPAWATGELSAPATCDTTDLGVSSGTLNVDLVWQANTINTTFYDNGTQLTGNNIPTSCNYDGTITLPAALSKPGYTFGGWRVKRCLIPSALIGTYGISRGNRSDSTAPNFHVYFANDYNLTEDNTWGVTWENGDKVTGVAFCSTTNDGKSYGQPGNPGTIGGYAVGGQHCWCQATHYTANAAPKCRLASPVWMFYDSLTADSCASGCANYCAFEAQSEFTSQAVLFGGNVAPEPAVPTCTIPSTLVSTNGSSYGYKNDSTGPQGADSNNTSDYNLTEDNTWGVTWSNGDKVTGVAFCSTTNDGKSFAQIGNPGTVGGYAAGGRYCWCKATHYTANNAQQCALLSPAWVFAYEDVSASDCVYWCADSCADGGVYYSDFRVAIFTGLIAQ